MCYKAGCGSAPSGPAERKVDDFPHVLAEGPLGKVAFTLNSVGVKQGRQGAEHNGGKGGAGGSGLGGGGIGSTGKCLMATSLPVSDPLMWINANCSQRYCRCRPC